MKSLTKFKIINWHYFWNETVDLQPISFLTGNNGSGKSTLLDGMLVILLGDTTGKYFNKAAQEKSNRTLKGYLRGEIGDNEEGGFRYLRDGRFTSYLAIEFHDDFHNSDFTLGCVFDSFEDGSNDHRYFCLEDKIPENEFIVDKVPMSYKDLSVFFGNNYAEKYTFFDSNKSYQEFIKRKFGGLKDKYFTLLKKSTSFSPITDIATFITEYVCDEQENVDITAMQENIFQYKQLENEAILLQNRIDRLNEIGEFYNKYDESKKNLVTCSFIIDKVTYQLSLDKLTNLKKQVESNKKRLAEIENELNENISNKTELNRKKIQLVKDKSENDTYRITSSLIEERKSLEGKINELESLKNENETNLREYANKYLNLCKNLDSSLKKIDMSFLDDDRVSEINDIKEALKKVIEACEQVLLALNDGIYSITEEILENWKISMMTFKNFISALCVSFARNINNLEKRLTSLKSDEDMMQKGVKPYENSLSTIKRELERQLSLKYNRPIPVNIFADLIDIEDKSWSNAIEAIIYNQKFNLFVEPKYYFDAYNILKTLLGQYNYYGTALVDQEKIIERNVKPDIGSLAEEIVTDHNGAQAYANYLMGKVKKCATIEQARISLNGITKECDLYRNFSLTRMNPRLYRTSYIGRNIGSKQIADKRVEIAELNMTISKYKDLFKVINEINALEVINTNEINTILSDVKSLSSLAGYRSSLKLVNEELENQDSTIIASIEKRLDAIEEDLAKLDSESNSLNIEKGNLQTSITTLQNEKITAEEANVKAIESRLNAYSYEFVMEVGSKVFNSEVDAGLKLIDINTKYTSLLQRTQYLVSNYFTSLKKVRRDYISDYHMSFDVDKETNEEFEQEMHNIRDVQLPEYKEKISDSYNKAVKQFKDDFISKLRNQIETVENQINDLNEALANSEFGDDKYYFTCKPNSIYKRYYDMFMDELLLKADEEETEFLNKYEDVMNDLFNQITSTSSKNKADELTQNVKVFTDYRTYLDFDLIVTNKEGIKQRLSKMIKKKSGGETQTPFYIAVLASFAQLYHANDKGELGNTIRLMIFDEAFSKMDRTRIKESFKLLRKFNLQAIISAPSEKISDISEHVDETLIVLRTKNYTNVRRYAKEK